MRQEATRSRAARTSLSEVCRACMPLRIAGFPAAHLAAARFAAARLSFVHVDPARLLALLLLTALLLSGSAWPDTAAAAEPARAAKVAEPSGPESRGPLRVLTARLPLPVKRVLALTCPGLAPADLVRYPQRPGTPEPTREAPPLRTVMVVDEQGHRSRVRLQEDALLVEPLGDCKPPERIERPDQIDGGRVSFGTGVIAEAWLAAATLKYRHGILGDVVTAAELRVTNRQGNELRYRLPDDAVFEDHWARMVVVDGQDAVLVVRTGLNDGAAAALFGLDRTAADASALVPLAQSEPLGAPNRWLNPVGVGDFDGSGSTGIAVVLTPHAGGSLAVYLRQGAKLVERYRAPGFSNHEIYSRELGMSAIIDANGDGIPDLAVPDATRGALRVVTFARGRFAELQHISHESPIVTGIAVQSLGDGRPSLVYALQDGTLVVATR